MQNRAFRHIALMLGLLFVVVVPTAQAGPVAFGDARQVVQNLQTGQTQDLRLRTVTQQQGGQQSSTSSSQDSSSLLANGATPQDGAGGQVVIEEGDIEGTVCDCGEITIPGGGFPKWPLIPLVGVICLTGICTPDDGCVGNCDKEPPIPEPATLFLFGSGLAALGAGVRRRYARVKLEKQTANATEV